MESEGSARRAAFLEDLNGLSPHIPVSTYRLQLNQDFKFQDAEGIVPYLQELGITDVYTSPYFMASEGSSHGYDITDPGSLSEELGGQKGFDRFSEALSAHNMGLIADIVPNHMGIASPRNAWWLDMMENGPSSPYASYFDIDWKPVREALKNKIIIPVLGDQYGSVLESGQLRLSYQDGGLFVNYYDFRFPLDPSTYDMVLGYRLDRLESGLGADSPEYQEAMSIVTALRHLPGRLETSPTKTNERMREKEVIKRRIISLYDSSPAFSSHLGMNISQFNGNVDSPESFDLLHCLLDAQVYRLSFWQVSTEEINYRRFFDINSLAAIRTEDSEVFENTHSLILRQIQEGKVTGLRVDHPDGLYDPAGYFNRLQIECALRMMLAKLPPEEAEEAMPELRALLDSNIQSMPDTPFYIVGEKILIGDERIPRDWPVCGTTGYAFMNSVGSLFVDTKNMPALTSAYNLFVGRATDFDRTLYERKIQIMETFMSSEINVLGNGLDAISESRRQTRDFTLNSLTDAIVETIACFPVYRTYITSRGADERDLMYIEHAIRRAKLAGREITPSVFDFLKDVLTLAFPESTDSDSRRMWLEFTMKFQQITGPIMAKAMEDTVFYCYNRLVSLNEVGGDPNPHTSAVRAFMQQNQSRSERWPHTLNATSTHDSKRSEDSRSRIFVISELATEWRESSRIWRRINRRFKTRIDGKHAPDSNDEYMMYQNLLGIWPMPGEPRDMESLRERMSTFMVKAIREAKTHSNWLNINTPYEKAATDFIAELLGSQDFVRSFSNFADKASWYGIFNSLSQTLLKITSPGVPDFYQGTELWNLKLVDPDNRAPVDYDRAGRALKELKEAEQAGLNVLARGLCDTLTDGRAKLLLTYKSLGFRRENIELFRHGGFIPLHAEGRCRDNIVGFMRLLGKTWSISIVPRLLAGIVPYGYLPLGNVWENTRLLLPMEAKGLMFRNVLTGSTVPSETSERGISLYLPNVLESFPVALLSAEGREINAPFASSGHSGI